MSQNQDYIKEDLENMVDDGDYEMIALIVLDDMPIEVRHLNVAGQVGANWNMPGHQQASP